MLVAALASTVLAAAPVTVASKGFTGLDVEPSRVRAWSEHFGKQLGVGEGLKVVTGKNATAIVSGTAAKVDAGFSVTVRLVDTASERALFVEALEAADEAGVLEALTGSARRARAALGVEAPGADAPLAKRPTTTVAPVSATASAPPQDWRPFALMGGGLVAVASSAVLFVGAINAQVELDEIARDPRLPVDGKDLVKQAEEAAARGKTQLGIAWGLAGAGAAMIVGGAVWAALSESSTASVAFVPTSGGAAVMVAGRFP